MNISFVIPIEPKGKERPRISTRGGFPRNFKSKNQSLYENQMAALIMQHRPDKPSDKAIRITIVACVAIPKSKSKKWKEAATLGIIRPIGNRNDLDNIYKNITDLMNGVFFEDDRQIVFARIEKGYSDNPRWEVTIADE